MWKSTWLVGIIYHGSISICTYWRQLLWICKIEFCCSSGFSPVLGHLLFSYYTKSIRTIAAKYNLKIHLYTVTDDTQLYMSLRFSSYREAIAALCRVEACINKVQTWMKKNKLQQIADKTQYLIAASPNVLQKLSLRPIRISGIEIEPSVSANNLRVMFDKHLNICEHVNQEKTQFLLKKIGDIRNCLTTVTTERDILTWLLQLSLVWLAK